MHIFENKKIFISVPKTGTTSALFLIRKKWKEKHFCKHASLYSFPLSKEEKNYKKITLIRDPRTWYKSRIIFDLRIFKNNKKNHASIFTETFKINNEFSKENIKILLSRFFNLTETFKEEKLLEDFKRNLKKAREYDKFCWLKYQFPEQIDDITPEFFENKSLYFWYLSKLGALDNEVKKYKLETEFSKMLKEEFDIHEKIKINISFNPKEDILQEIFNSVEKNEEYLLERLGYK